MAAHHRERLRRRERPNGINARVATRAAGRSKPSGRLRYANTANPIVGGNQPNRPSPRNRKAVQRPHVQKSKNVLSLSVSAKTWPVNGTAYVKIHASHAVRSPNNSRATR